MSNVSPESTPIPTVSEPSALDRRYFVILVTLSAVLMTSLIAWLCGVFGPSVFAFLKTMASLA